MATWLVALVPMQVRVRLMDKNSAVDSQTEVSYIKSLGKLQCNVTSEFEHLAVKKLVSGLTCGHLCMSCRGVQWD